MNTNPSDLATFRDQLGRQLVAAARRQQSYGRSPDGRWSTIAAAGVVAAAAIVVTAVFVVGLVRTDPVGADVFAIDVVDGEVRIDVVEMVRNPSRVEDQLYGELGIEADLVAVPTPPELEGRIVAISSEGPDVPELEHGNDRAIARATFPDDFSGYLVVEFGRRAEPGEFYQATTTAPICRDLWGMTPDQAAPIIAAASSSARYETLDLMMNATADVDSDTIPADYMVVDVVYLSEDQLLLTFAAALDSLPRHPNCN